MDGTMGIRRRRSSRGVQGGGMQGGCVQEEGGAGSARKRHLFGRPKETWGKPPSYVGGGMGMKELTEEMVKEEWSKWEVPWRYTEGNGDDEGSKEGKEEEEGKSEKSGDNDK